MFTLMRKELGTRLPQRELMELPIPCLVWLWKTWEMWTWMDIKVCVHHVLRTQLMQTYQSRIRTNYNHLNDFFNVTHTVFSDVAVSAPYDSNGAGNVIIFHGSPQGLKKSQVQPYIHFSFSFLINRFFIHFFNDFIFG